jgi:hypothetical protein
LWARDKKLQSRVQNGSGGGDPRVVHNILKKNVKQPHWTCPPCSYKGMLGPAPLATPPPLQLLLATGASSTSWMVSTCLPSHWPPPQCSCALTYFGTSEFSNLGGCQAPEAFGLRPSSAKYSFQVGHLPQLNKHMQFLQHAAEFSLIFISVNRHSQDFVVAE